MMPQDPYRDDRLTLVAENERLRAELRTLRSRRRRGPLVALGLVGLGAADVAAFDVVRSFVNASDDAHALGGFALAAVLIVAHLVLAVRVASRGE